MKDFLLDEDNDLKIDMGDFVIGESKIQEVTAILVSTKGEFKDSPIMGLDVVTKIRSGRRFFGLGRDLRLQLARDGKEYDEIKEEIRMVLTTE